MVKMDNIKIEKVLTEYRLNKEGVTYQAFGTGHIN